MKPSDFDYNLPEELIAQHPADERDSSRLLVLDRNSGKIEHTIFRNITDYLSPSDLLVLNDTSVFPARLIGRKKKTGGKVEVFLLKEISKDKWEVLTKYKGGKIPRSKLRLGTPPPLLKGDKEGLEVIFGDSELECKIYGSEAIFNCNGDVHKMLEKYGNVPLPPYIKRTFDKGDIREFDCERYQTVYAEKRGAVAAPTAGLHFTKELLADIKKKDTEIAKVTLHVGYGTFKPVKSENIKDHKIDPEYYEIKESEAKKINNAVKSYRRIVAVGTTTVRTLESAVFANPPSPPFAKGGMVGVRSGNGYTDLFIYNGFNFKLTSVLLTNFHLPKSSLLMLVCAFAGQDMILYAYSEAIKKGYRFYSYGDAMLII
ncbi:MAG: tRNA preQ1(34) S-adenosylmethionine ribosyltransferase-isomerase QueA [Nitrospinota bacterium]